MLGVPRFGHSPGGHRQDADGDGLDYTNELQFAFCAFPAAYKQTAADSFIINEVGIVYRKDTRGQPVTKWPGADPTDDGWMIAR